MQSAIQQRGVRLLSSRRAALLPGAPARLALKASKPAFVARVASAEAPSTATTPRRDERGFALNEVCLHFMFLSSGLQGRANCDG